MKVKFFLFFIFFTLFFLFYPGDSLYFNIFAYNSNLFNREETETNININPVPFLKFNDSPIISAQGAYVIDLPSFTPVYEKNFKDRFFPASTTKIITALVAYDIYKTDDVITVKRTTTEGQIMNLVPGEKITVENLFYGLLVHSANDAAYVLADNYGMDKFIDLMNKKASSLSMKNSHFINPAGLDADNQYTSPFDLALAAREFLKNKYLAKIVSTKEIIISDIDYKYFHTLTNVNKLLGEIQGIGGLKTGYTENAGENLVSFYKKGDHQFVIVLLKSDDRFADTRNVVNWINNSVGYYSVKN